MGNNYEDKTIKRTNDETCPVCGSTELYGDGDWGVENGCMWIRLECCNCGLHYVDVYRMSESIIFCKEEPSSLPVPHVQH